MEDTARERSQAVFDENVERHRRPPQPDWKPPSWLESTDAPHPVKVRTLEIRQEIRREHHFHRILHGSWGPNRQQRRHPTEGEEETTDE